MVAKASASIGRRLYAARTKRNMTMAELAEKSGLSPSGINHIEKGHTSPSAETLEALAGALDIDPCWLAYGTGNKPDWLSKQDKENKAES